MHKIDMALMRTAIFSAKFENLDNIREFARQAAQDAGLSPEDVYAVMLSVDEASTNIIEHAYGQDKSGEIECTCSADGDCLRIMLRDHGDPFNPMLADDPDLTADLEDRPIGGLGIYLIKNLMDRLQYESLGESGNLLTMVKSCKDKK